MPREGRSDAPTLLVVDDETMVRVSTARMLERRGFHALTAATPLDALDILRGDAPVALLISDIVMPGMYGTELILHARALRPGCGCCSSPALRTSRTPVTVLSQRTCLFSPSRSIWPTSWGRSRISCRTERFPLDPSCVISYDIS